MHPLREKMIREAFERVPQDFVLGLRGTIWKVSDRLPAPPRVTAANGRAPIMALRILTFQREEGAIDGKGAVRISCEGLEVWRDAA